MVVFMFCCCRMQHHTIGRVAVAERDSLRKQMYAMPSSGEFLGKTCSNASTSSTTGMTHDADFHFALWDLWKMPLIAQFLRHVQISILKILNLFLRLKFLPSLNLNKNEHFSKVSLLCSPPCAMFTPLNVSKKTSEVYPVKLFGFCLSGANLTGAPCAMPYAFHH